MKTLLVAILVVGSQLAIAQSKSYATLHDRFVDLPQVESFSVRGWVGRLVLNIAMPADEKLRQAMDHVKHIRFMTIPRGEFERQNLTVKGFRTYLLSDKFELLADIRDQKDQFTIYHRMEGKRHRYFVLVEESDEIVAFEMKGYIDPTIFSDRTIGFYNK